MTATPIGDLGGVSRPAPTGAQHAARGPRLLRRRSSRPVAALLSATIVCASVLTASLAATGAPAAAQAAGDPYPDDGLPAQPIAATSLVSERTEVLAAGVVGSNEQNDSFPNTDIRVTSFTEIGDTIYVGGKFTGVQPSGSAGPTVDQRFLAAFDRDTGTWIDTFRPTLDGNVWDLDVAPDGDLLVSGQFATVNGAPNTAAIAKLDPVTGAVDPAWRVGVRLTGSTQRPIVRTIDVDGGYVYLGGNFTRITGSDGQERNAGRLARVHAADGRGDGTFLPNIDGVVFDVDAAGERVYAAGNFFYVNGTWSIGLGVIQQADGQLVPGLNPIVRTYVRNNYNSYQQGVLEVGDEVWLAGAQHSYQVYRRSDMALLRTWISAPWGDAQAVVELDGYVYIGTHANSDTYLYRDAYRWPELTGATTRLPIRWMGAFDDATNEQVDWYPQVGVERGEGAWALFGDSTGCLWAGGDFNRGSYDGNVPRYVGGFAKFCAPDTTPPEPPTDPTATLRADGVDLAWTGSTDDRGGQVRYEILKNDRVFASFISITTFRDPDGTATDRYFVRARDEAGNYSATTRVFTAQGNDTTRPTTPQDLAATIEPNGDVTLTWTPSTDNIGVAGYRVFDSGAPIDDVTTNAVTVPAPAAGDHWYQVLAYDTAGNESFRTEALQVTIDPPPPDDVTPPTTPRDLAAVIEANGDVTLTWTPSTDDIGVDHYIVYRNNAVIADPVTDPTHVVPAPATGSHWYQVRAVDAAGNESFKTAPLRVDISAGDSTPPTTPRDLAGTQEANGDVTLTWTPSTDDVGVDRYVVLRNGAVIADAVPGDTATYTVPAPAVGTHWYQVRAVDAAGNESFKTPPLAFVVTGGADVTPPTTPRDLAAVIEANGDVTLTWTPSTDDIGVDHYIVYRNNAVIADPVTGPTHVVPAPATGSHWYQVRAVDAAGNESFKTAPLRVDIP